MFRRLRLLTTVSLLTLAAVPAAQAQWSSDPWENLALADRESEQAVPKIAGTSDGGSYVGWYDLASGNYDVYLQRLDPLGYELWPHNGILISGHPQDSWIMDWHLITDSADSAVLAFADIRDGANPSLHVYRVGPGGEMLWGPDGITLSLVKGTAFSSGARIAEASDGDLVFVWSTLSAMGGGKIMMQRVSPDGVVRFQDGGITISDGKGNAPCFPDITATDGGSVIVSWVTDMDLESRTKFLRAQKVLADGAAAWQRPVSVFDAYSLPIAHRPGIQSDGDGGALLVWHYTPWLIYTAAIQHLDAQGVEIFPHNGVTVSTDPELDHQYPSLSYDPLTGETYVLFREYDSVQGLWGIYGQRFSPDGQRLWGDAGAVLLPLEPIERSMPLSVPCEGGAMVFLMERPLGSWRDISIIGMRVDGDGNLLWGGAPVSVSSYPSAKGHLTLAGDVLGGVKIVWEDDRIDAQDVYGQNVNADGTLGN